MLYEVITPRIAWPFRQPSFPPSRFAMPQPSVTAAALIIGNEILSGRTQDVNLAFLGRRLNELGIRLMEVRVVPDVEDAISYNFV